MGSQVLNFSTDEIFKRLRKLESVETNKELASRLEINEKTLSSWKTKNTIPLESLLSIANKYDISLDWLITGEHKIEPLSATEKMLLGAFNELDEKQQLQAMLFVGNLANGSPNNRPANEGNQYHNQQQSGGDSFNVGGDYIFNQR